ncbi:sugar-binding protein [Paenibacillus oryzisoli]|uniref:BIG2 domain-containing protein n=1 Tax=Paenibacillus oryzisoli TaxID=1850517 RepID=A0A198AC10_9BACL|nr:sugar-binding protein [Paenibacillus oryzisoli]OAS18697.1 hypothetical protein A8708_29210 [Paenibacillus oryzisoli]
MIKLRVWMVLLMVCMVVSSMTIIPPSRAEAALYPMLLSSDFEDGTSSGWGVSKGTFSVVADGSNVYKTFYTSGSTTERLATAGSTTWTNYSVEAKLKLYSGDYAGLLGRYKDTDNYYNLTIYDGENLVRLGKKVAGASVTLGSYAMQIVPNTIYTLKLDMDGSQIVASVNGTPIITVTDTGLASGKIGTRGYKATYSIDDVSVMDKRVPASIVISPQNALLLDGESRQYSVTVYDSVYNVITGVPLTWSSGNTAIASVSGTGIVYGEGAGTTSITASYGSLQGSANVTIQAIVPVTPIEMLKTLSTITVDGILSESVWSLDNSALKVVSGTNDNTVTFGTLWNEKYLYVGVKVIDNNVYNDSTDGWDDDSVELFIDANHNHSVTYDVYDWQFRKGYNDTVLWESQNETAGVLHGWSNVTGGYTVEMAIPWENLGVVPSAGVSIGFDIANNDDDNGGIREGQRVWAGIADNYKNTLSFGDLILSATTVGTTPTPPTAPPAVNRYVLPAGAGTMDGSSWANAMAGDVVGGLQAAWDATGLNNTMYIGSGTYTVPQTLQLSTGGIDITHRKKLSGFDTGSGLPIFQGSWTLANQVSTPFINVPLGVNFWSISDLHIKNYMYGIYANGQHEGIRITNIEAENISDGIYLWGKATRSNPNVGSHDIVIKDSNFSNFTKSAVRFRNGNYLASVINTTADAGGSAFWYSGNFPIGFRIGNSPESANIFDHDILFQDVTARNSYHEDGTNYWNGDGFAAERQTYNLTYVRAKSFNHTDGGFDDKSSNPIWIDSVAFGSKRNFRLWSLGKATLINSIAGYANKQGGSGGAYDLWVGGSGNVDAYYSTFYDSASTPIGLEDANQVNIYDSIVGKSSGTAVYTTAGGTITFTRSDPYIPGTIGQDPQFVNAVNSAWEGGSNDFNSQYFGNTKGYYEPSSSAANYTATISTGSLSLNVAQHTSVSASVTDGGTPISDPENIVWYSEDGDRLRVKQSRGATAEVTGLEAGTTQLVAVYKGARTDITVTVH